MQPPALTLERAFGRLFALENRIAAFQRQYGEREDLTGLQLLLRALFFTVKETQRLLVEESRRLLDHPQTIESTEVDSFTPLVADLIQNLERTVAEPLQILDRTHERRFDPLVQPLSRLGSQIASDVEIIFQPGDHYDYAAGFWINQKLLDFARPNSKHLEEVVTNTFPRMVIIQYPALAHAETFWHAILGHELSHIALRRGDAIPLEESLFEEAFDEFRREVASEVERRLKEAAVSEDVFQSRKDEETALLRTRAKRWFIELACDDLALALVGPAYFFALSELTAPASPWEYGESSDKLKAYNRYPPLWWRLERSSAGAQAQIESFTGEHWEAVKSLIDDFAKRIPAKRRALPELEKRIAEAALQRVDPGVIAPDAVLDLDELRDQFEPIWQKLEVGIAPAEWVEGRENSGGALRVWDREGNWSRPMEWRAILNVSYLAYLLAAPAEASAHLAEAEVRAQTRQAKNFDALTAVELSELQRRVQGLRGELDGLFIPDVPPRSERLMTVQTLADDKAAEGDSDSVA